VIISSRRVPAERPGRHTLFHERAEELVMATPERLDPCLLGGRPLLGHEEEPQRCGVLADGDPYVLAHQGAQGTAAFLEKRPAVFRGALPGAGQTGGMRSLIGVC
jgi:hypothetical protein